MAAALWAVLLLQAPPLPEGNAFVHELVARHRQREEALSRYTFDVLEGPGTPRRTWGGRETPHPLLRGLPQ